MLLLKPKQQNRKITHAESGAVFTIRPLSPTKHESVRARHRKGDGVKIVPFMEEMAKFVIVNWEGVGSEDGEAACTDESKSEFGRNHALNVMPWLLSEAEGLDQYLAEEKDAAKND